MEAQQLQYLYAFIPSKEYDRDSAPQLDGIDRGSYLEFVDVDGITAVICQVGEEEFSEENLAKNTEDMGWLQEKAFHHHQIMNELHTSYTIIPLKFATIYKNRSNLEAIVRQHQQGIRALLEKLENKEEWNVKIYAKDDKFRQAVMTSSEEIEKKQAEIARLPKGRQFFEKKKIDQFIEEQVKKEIEITCRQIHEQLTAYTSEERKKKNWNKKVTGKAEDMHWNCAYLLPSQNAGSFLERIKQEQDKANKEENGMQFDITGPWPAFHFSDFIDRGVKSGT